jgi:hypothetical protein
VTKSNDNDRGVKGTIKHLFQSHQSTNGKILNALDFPLLLSPHPPTSVASDLAAWQKTIGLSGCDQEYPSSSTRWGLAATAGAYTKSHIDCDGFATYLQCKVGSKWWVVFGPPEGKDTSVFANWNFVHMLQSKKPGLFKLLQTGQLRAEAVLLTPGTELCVIGCLWMFFADFCTVASCSRIPRMQSSRRIPPFAMVVITILPQPSGKHAMGCSSDLCSTVSLPILSTPLLQCYSSAASLCIGTKHTDAPRTWLVCEHRSKIVLSDLLQAPSPCPSCMYLMSLHLKDSMTYFRS